jgi:hypothetical protein
MKFFAPVLVMVLMLSCQEKPKIDHTIKLDTTSVVDDRISDTTKVLVANLPARFDSTDVLIFTIGLVNLEPQGRGLIKSGYRSSSSGSEISYAYFNQDNINGNFVNLVFRDKNGNERKLTNNKIIIDDVRFLRDVFRKTNKAYLLYQIYDRDTNGDQELNYNDLKALYIGNLDGTTFTKLSKELHDLHDYNFIKEENRVYFRTLEDRDNDGNLTARDKFHYYVINFNETDYKVVEYDPLKVFKVQGK